jgi:hypothetical protein
VAFGKVANSTPSTPQTIVGIIFVLFEVSATGFWNWRGGGRRQAAFDFAAL